MHHYAGVGSTCWWGTRLRARNHTGVVIEENGQPERNQKEKTLKRKRKSSVTGLPMTLTAFFGNGFWQLVIEAKTGHSVFICVIVMRSLWIQQRRVGVLQPLPSSLTAFIRAIQSVGYGLPRRTRLCVHLVSDQCSVIRRWPRTISMICDSWVERIGCRMCRISSIGTCRGGMAKGRSRWRWGFGSARIRIIRVDL